MVDCALEGRKYLFLTSWPSGYLELVTCLGHNGGRPDMPYITREDGGSDTTSLKWLFHIPDALGGAGKMLSQSFPYRFRNKLVDIGVTIPESASWKEWEEIKGYLESILKHVLTPGDGEA